MITAVQLVAILFCVTAEAFFSGMETGIISIRRLRLRHRLRQGDAAARSIAYFLEQPDRLLGTTLVGTNLCVVISSVLWASMATRLWGGVGSTLAPAALTVILLVFGEFIPKAWFSARPYVRSARFIRLLRVAWIVFRPFGLVMTWVAGLILPGKSTARQDLCALADRGELKLLATEGEQHGVLTAEEREMIHRTVELAEKSAKVLMTPIERVVTVPSSVTLQDFLALAKKEGYSRFPVHDHDANRFTGIIAVLDVLSVSVRDDKVLDDLIVPPVFIPAETPADEIMPILRLAHQSVGLVTDRDGAVMGLVTTDDILRQIVHAPAV